MTDQDRTIAGKLTVAANRAGGNEARSHREKCRGVHPDNAFVEAMMGQARRRTAERPYRLVVQGVVSHFGLESEEWSETRGVQLTLGGISNRVSLSPIRFLRRAPSNRSQNGNGGYKPRERKSEIHVSQWHTAKQTRLLRCCYYTVTIPSSKRVGWYQLVTNLSGSPVGKRECLGGVC